MGDFYRFCRNDVIDFIGAEKKDPAKSRESLRKMGNDFPFIFRQNVNRNERETDAKLNHFSFSLSFSFAIDSSFFED